MNITNYTFDELITKFDINININIKFNDDDDKELFVEIMNGNFNKDYNYKNITNSTILCYIGKYYQIIKKDYDEMKKYYLMAIQKGHIDSMYNLVDYYQNIEKNYDEMKKYYSTEIKKSNHNFIDNVSNYYKDTEKIYDLVLIIINIMFGFFVLLNYK